MSRKRILFFVESITLAQVVRAVELARSLDPSEYDVHFASGEFSPMVFDGTDFTRWPLHTIDADRAARDLEKGKRLYDAGILRTYVDEELAIMNQVKPDIVVGDFRLSLSISAPTFGAPQLTMINGYWSPFAERRGWPLPDHPMVDLVGDEVAGKYFPKAMPYAFSHFAQPINAVRKRYRLPEIGSLLEVLTHGDRTLYLDVPELIPTASLPAAHQFLGAVLWAPPVTLDSDLAAQLMAGPPTVYVTLGSSGRIDRLPMVLEALGSLPVKVLVATAGREAPSQVPANVKLVPFVPGDEVAKRSALVISNGGSTTGYQALAEGTPVLGIASNLDQALSAQFIASYGAGASVRAGAATVESIRRLAWEIMSSPSYREAAERLASAFARYDAKTRFAQNLEAVMASEGRAA